MDAVSNIDAMLTEADVDALFEVVLGRACDSPAWRAELAASGIRVRDYLHMLRHCQELRDRLGEERERDVAANRRDPMRHRVPDDLTLTPAAPRRVLMIGSCLMHPWSVIVEKADPPGATDLFMMGVELPASPPQPVDAYDFQIIHLPLRSILPDLHFAKLKQTDRQGHERLLRECSERIPHLLQTAMRWNIEHGLLTFVLPFIPPQQNAIGRLLPRYDLRNPVFFIERLNEALYLQIAKYRNTYFFDFNEVLASHGRRFAQEDSIIQMNHGGFLGDFDPDNDQGRIEPMRQVSAVFDQHVNFAVTAGWHEMLGMWRTLRQTDSVKMVVVDLDDTLWRGTIAELDLDNLPTAEEWPRGLWEALNVLRRRGILLAIISNNDEQRVLEAWTKVFAGALRLEDFAVRRIDWRAKSEKMQEVLAATNLLARNVVFIDDNPIQRAEVKAAFPELRVLGGEPYLWRHILLWAPETQVPYITAESDTRTEMVHAQQQREVLRATQSRGDFLALLKVRMTLFGVDGPGHPRFARVLELINKTNQFNTTGARWTEAQLESAMAGGMEIYAFDLADIHTAYGLVGVILIDGNIIRQFVMSCRVLGLEAEIAAVARMVALARARGHHRIGGRVVETERNLPCRNLYERCDFRMRKDLWVREADPPPPIAQHITLIAPALPG